MAVTTPLNTDDVLSQAFKKFQCTICEEVFDFPDALVHHDENNHPIPSELKCDICDFVSKSRHSLNGHKRQVHKIARVHQCEKCPFAYSSSHSLKLHEKNIHEGIKFKCDVCDKTFTLEKQLANHTKRTHDMSLKDYFECPNCLGKFKTKETLKNHSNICDSHLQKKFHQDLQHVTWYKCEICEKSLYGIGTLRGHIRQVHNQNGWHKCGQCNLTYPTKVELDHHVKMIHEEPDYQCNICEKKFRFKRLYEIHVATDIHDKNGNWHCEICGYVAKERGQLNVHRRIVHENKKLFKCENCPSAYNDRSNLEMHIANIHDGVKYKCDLCSESFTLKKNVARHKKRKHIKNRPLFKCDKCLKDFVAKYNLQLHLKKCESNLQMKEKREKEVAKWHKCNICEKTYMALKP